MFGSFNAVRAWLPEGHRLPPEQWETRHRVMVTVLALHVPVFLAWGLLKGYPLLHSVLDIAPLLGPAILASMGRFTRRGREVCVAIGLLTSSAVLVHLMDGATEAHFHFFVVVSLLALYEEWFPYLLAFAYVLAHHGLMSTIAPASVFNHDAAVQNPWRWAIIHSAFIAAQGLICLVGWKINEDARREAAVSEERFVRAFDDAPTAMALVGLDGTVLEANDVLEQHWLAATGGRPIVGSLVTAFVDRSDLGARAFPGHTALELRHADGSGWGQWHHAPMLDEDGHHNGWISHCVDVTTAKRLEADLSWQAEHDPLTSLPNRTLFTRRLKQTLAAGEGATIVFLDLDDFKLINDSLGHGVGDQLLQVIAGRLDEAVRPQDVVARFGGDEFVVLLAGVSTEDGAVRAVARITDALRPPVHLAGDDRRVGTSIGLRVMAPGECGDGDALLADADAAMYRAKERGKGRCVVFDDTMRAEADQTLELESALYGVERRGELCLMYQPLVDLSSGGVDGVEALLRWDHPTLGRVSPMDFIPLAESNGTIVAIGAWVVDEACRQLAEWEDPSLKMSVNVSSRQLVQAGFVETVAAALARHGVPARQLCLEITETVVLGDTAVTTTCLAELTKLGVELAVDDFGVGYASLSHLRQLLPVTTLKIDKSFVDGVLEGVEDAAIVEGVIRLAHSLGLDVVAEGIEQGEQARLLASWGCEVGQGYHFARPLPAGEIAALLTGGPLWTARVG